MTAPALTAPAARGARLAHALADGLSLPDGPVCVIGANALDRFDPLPPAQLRMVQPFRPDHDALAAAGHTVTTEPAPAPTVLVCLPRARDAARARIAQAAALRPEMMLVDGQKTDGVDSLFKALRARMAVQSVAKAHGRLIWADPRGADLDDWAAQPVWHDTPLGRFRTVPGVFSAGGVDPGSALLAEALPPALPARMADLGAGWGYLAAAVLARDGVAEAHLVEADAQALALARDNVRDPRARFHWADATATKLPGQVDGIVMNPPFHAGRAARPELGLAFIAAAARLLGPRGQLWLVANRHLPYQPALSARFAHSTVLAETAAFRVWHARAPRKGAL